MSSRQQKSQLIEDLTQKLSSLKEQKNKLDDEAYEWAEKRDKLNEKTKNLRLEIQGLRSERDKINEKVKELKQQRNETATKIHEKIDETRKLNEDNKGLAKKRPSTNHQALQEEIDSIEWKIQTTSMTLQEDKEHVEKVKQLETQLKVHKKLERVSQQAFKLRTEAKSLKTQSEQYHKELTENAQKSQDLHKKMFEKIEESKKSRAEADALHKQFVEAREKTRPIQDDIVKISIQIRQLKGELQEEEQKERKESESAIRETLEKRAIEKMKRREKLSWEEFQILAEKGLTTQD